VSDVIELPIVGSPEQIPAYARPGDAGADLKSAEALVLAPGERALVATGVRFALPDGYAAFVVPRSGLAVKHGISIVNSPGTIDAGYRGEIKVPLINLDPNETFEISVGDRIAQLIVMPVTRALFTPVEALSESQRGDGGFGSTGVSEQA
jgi:dUTP pyrophosphatase